MSRIDTLPDDQRAVLQLLLRQGRRYDTLSGLLNVDESAVRRRAHDALAALGPAETPGLPTERRDQIADYLLGQDSEDQRFVTYGFLEGSAGGRAWARVVAGELRELAGKDLPPIPADGRDDAAAPTAPEPGTSAAAAATAPPLAAGRHAGPRSLRRGGAILLGGVALVAAAVALFFALRGGNDEGGDATPAASTTATQPQAQVEAQANLVPPSNRKNLKALGVVLVQRAQGQEQIVAAVQGLPKPKSGGYGIWLYSSPGKAQWLGFFASQDKQGRLLARGRLKASIAGYREVLVTREAKGNPPRPGAIFLRGPIQTADGTGG
jgi:hypothetical protein